MTTITKYYRKGFFTQKETIKNLLDDLDYCDAKIRTYEHLGIIDEAAEDVAHAAEIREDLQTYFGITA